MKAVMTICYLCGQPVDDSVSSGDHVIPRTLRSKGPPKIKGFDYGGKLPTHPKCNNRFGDETHIRKAQQLLKALRDPNITLDLPAPGNPKGRVLALNVEKFPGFSQRDFRFFGIHDGKSDSTASFDEPEYYADKPRPDLRKTMLCTVLSVLAKSAAALLVKRRLANLPGNWNIVCVPYLGDTTRIDLSSFFEETIPFAPDIRVRTKKFEACSWISVYEIKTVTALFFFLMDDDRDLVEGIRERFPYEECLQFQGMSLMKLVGHDWPSVGLSAEVGDGMNG